MHKSARAPGVTGTLQLDGQPGMAVSLSLESSYLIVEMTADRDAVAVEFLRRSRVDDHWHLRRTDRPGWQIITNEFPTAWLAQLRRGPGPSRHGLLVIGLFLCGVLLLSAWLTQ